MWGVNQVVEMKSQANFATVPIAEFEDLGYDRTKPTWRKIESALSS